MSLLAQNQSDDPIEPAPSRQDAMSQRLENLPLETLEAIVYQLDSDSLLNLQLVSTRFHFLASAELYRLLEFEISSSSTDDNDDPSFRAADALQTINTSEYNYAQHVKHFKITHGLTIQGLGSTPAYADPLGRMRVVFDSTSDASKLLSTAVLQLVRKAPVLETFIWDVPIELSGLVYRALQNIPSLCHLHMRLDGGPIQKLRPGHSPSYYPPLPPTDAFPSLSGISSSNHISPANPKQSSAKRKKKHVYSFWSDSRPFSGFATLKVLEITRLSNLETLTELRQCIRACSSSLRCLTLTIDSRFGSKPGRIASSPPPNDFDSLSDTDLDDDDLLDVPASQTGDVSEADRRQEKIALEGVLASVFDLQNASAQGRRLERKLGLEGGKCFVDEDWVSNRERLEDLIKSLRENDLISGKEAPSSSSRLEKYRMMRDLAELFITKHDPKVRRPLKTNSQILSTSKKYPKPSKYKPPPYPAPVDLEEIEWEPQAIDPLPWTLESNLAEPSSKSWSHSSKHPQNSKKYSLDSLPPLPFSNSTGSSSDAAMHYPYGVSKGSQPNGIVSSSGFSKTKPHTNTSKALPPLSNQDPSPLSPSYALYSTTSSANLPGKPNKNKQGVKPKHSSSNNLPPPMPYDGITPSKPLASPAMNVISESHNSSKPSNFNHKPPATAKWKISHYKPWSAESSSSDSESEFSYNSKSSLTTPFFSAEPGQIEDDGIDVDMEHPDADGSEFFEDQEEIASDSSDTEIQSSLKKEQFSAPDSQRPKSNNDHGHRDDLHIDSDVKSGSLTAKMNEYIRSTHGIQLETLRLQHVPLKASILGKAVDLWTLQHLTLLETGPQDTFWALLAKLTTPDTPIIFRTIHTDNVSNSLLRYLESFHTLEELFLHERRSRNKADDQDILVDMQSIRRQALRPHVKTLRRLMLRNERNDHWDLDVETLLLLGRQAKKLDELAINMKSQVYHWLLQLLPAFNSLRALHLIVLRGGDRGPSMNWESLAYSIDSLVQCSNLKLRYLAIAERIAELGGHEQFRKQLERMMEGPEAEVQCRQSDRKGKGKAVESAVVTVDSLSDQEADPTLAMLQTAQRKLRAFRRFEDIKGVKVFSAEIRMGRL